MTVGNNNAEVEGSASELVVDASVVSLSALMDTANRLDGVRRLKVRRKAIVTPAVRDLLRQRKIELAYCDDGEATRNGKAAASDVLRLVVAAAGANELQTAALIKLLARMPIAVEHAAPAGLLAAIDELAGQVVKSATIGLLLTSEPAAAACLTNRMAGVRAMTMGDAPTLAGLSVTARAIGANLLIVDPAGRSPFAMKTSIERFCQGAPRACPPQWRGRLD